MIANGEFRQSVALTYSQNLSDSQGEIYCSGTLIGPRLVITAAHCLISGAKAFKVSLEDFKKHTGIYIGDSPNENLLPLSSVTVMSLQVQIFPQGPTIHSDLALIMLPQDVDLQKYQIQPVPLTIPTEKMLGAELTSVGYGMIEEKGKKGFKTAFNLPLRSFNGLVGLGVGEPFVASPGACHGDSGGSAYLKDRDGILKFVGVEQSISNHPCGEAATYFVPFSPGILAWIKSFRYSLFFDSTKN